MCSMWIAEHTGCKKNRQKFAICAPSHNFVGLYLRNWGMYWQSEKNLLNSNISSMCLHNMANFGPLTAEIRWPVWGTPANFNRFRILPSLLQPRRSPEANQTVHNVWPRGVLAPDRILCGAKFTLCLKSCVLLYWQRYCTARQQRAWAKLCGVVQGMELWNCHRRRHLYSAEQPSCWALAHILVIIALPLQLYFIRTTCTTTFNGHFLHVPGFWGILLINHFSSHPTTV